MMHDDTTEGRAIAARTLAAWALDKARSEEPRKAFQVDWVEVAAYAGTLAVMAACVAVYLIGA